MPIYEYECPKCKGTQEVIKSVAMYDAEEYCECNDKYPMVRLCGNAGFQLKGDGWAEDGYDKLIGDINITRKRDGKGVVEYDDIHGTNFQGLK